MKLKHITGLLIVFLLLSGCSSWKKAYEEAAATTFKVALLKGPGAMGFLKAMEPGIKPSLKLGDTVEYIIEENEDSMYARLLKEEVDIASVPTDMAARLYNSGEKYQVAAINTSGYLYVLADSENISSFSDLKGKVVQITGKGSAGDVIFRYLLMQNGVNPEKDLTLKYITSIEEQVQNALNENGNVMLLPEPWVSKILREKANFKISLNIQEEWGRINGASVPMPQTCLIVKKEIPSQKMKEWGMFLDDYRTSINWVNSNPDKAAELIEKHDIGIPKDVTGEVIPHSGLGYFDVSSSKQELEKYFNIFLGISPESIGGKLPDTDFYNKKQKWDWE